jgi:hypothetical protein
MVLNFLDTIEEHRDLSLEEWNFRATVQDNLNGLLEQQRIYWKQRGRIKWATLGDENTKFFHANATVWHSKNYIRSLQYVDGVVRTQHDEKALLLWESFITIQEKHTNELSRHASVPHQLPHHHYKV